MVRKTRKSVSGLTPLKRLVYLISPKKINKKFYSDLDAVLSFGNVKFFQLRLKKIKIKDLFKIANKIRKITLKHKVKFIINDDFILTLKTKADGCHMGQLDGSIKTAKKKLRNKILGVTCHNSKTLAKNAVKDKASYLALRWAKKNIRKPIVVIGGINNLNYKKLLKAGAKYIAISSYIWDNPKLKSELAIKKFI